MRLCGAKRSAFSRARITSYNVCYTKLLRGPWAHLRGRDLVTVAMGGNQAATGDPDRPPVRCSMPTSYYHAGPEAALGVLMALYAREDTGLGHRITSYNVCYTKLLRWP